MDSSPPTGPKPRRPAPITKASTRQTLVVPADLLGDAARRLGVAAVAMGMFGVINLVMKCVVPGVSGTVPNWPSTHAVILVVMAAVSMAVFVLSLKSGWPPQRLIDLGLAFEVFIALCISTLEFMQPSSARLSTDQGLPWVSWVFVILVMFPVLVPTTRGRTLAAALAAASMGPLAYCLTRTPSSPFSPTIFGSWCTYFWSVAPLALAVNSVILKLVGEIDEARVMGSYVLEEKLGEGGMGEVWRARHSMLSRPAAVKIIPAQSRAGGASEAREVLQRFEREARATAALRSPHTVVLYDYGVTDDGLFYYVMELLDGMDLETLVERHGAVSAGRCIHLLRQVCRSLDEAHKSGMVHRDIKPANLYACRLGLETDFVKVLDFGLVKVESTPQDAHLTLEGWLAGTPAYMAPEQARGEVADARTDIYALGCVGYWLLTGEPVFPQTNPMDVILHHISTTPDTPSHRSGQPVPEDLERVIMACLEKDPALRPQTAGNMERMLASCHAAGSWGEVEALAWWRGVAA